MTALEIDSLSRKIKDKVYKENGVLLVSIGIYALNSKDEETKKIRKEIINMLKSFEGFIQIHGFYINKYEKIMYFDIVLDYDNVNRDEIYKKIYSEISKQYSDYKLEITLDIDAYD